MKIISKFRDYYDSALAFGQDSRIPYLRLEEPLGDDVVKELGWWKMDRKNFDLPMAKDKPKTTFRSFMVIVAGKVYRAIRAQVDSTRTYNYRTYEYSGDPGRAVYFYTYADFCDFVEARGFVVKDIYGKTSFKGLSIAQEVEAFLSKQGTTELESYLVEKRLVVAFPRLQESSYDNYQWHWAHNAPLREVHFYKVMGDVQVFQELDMYVTGVLGQQAKEMVTISDKDRVYQHGFDSYSFRKLPQEKGRKKQNR